MDISSAPSALDDLKRLGKPGIGGPELDNCRALIATFLEESGRSAELLTLGQQTQMLRQALHDFAGKCRAIALHAGVIPPVEDPMLSDVLAGAEILGLTNEKDFARLLERRRFNRAEWDRRAKRSGNLLMGKRLRGGVWRKEQAVYDQRAVANHEGEILAAFLSRFKAYLQDERAATEQLQENSASSAGRNSAIGPADTRMDLPDLQAESASVPLQPLTTRPQVVTDAAIDGLPRQLVGDVCGRR